MDRDGFRRSLDVLLLAAVRDKPSHGYAIIQSLNDLSDGAFDLPEGTVYPALHRLERDGLLTSRWSNVDGRRRRVYRLTARGQADLAQRAAEWRGFARAMNAVIRGA